jgi:hypothetical protein
MATAASNAEAEALAAALAQATAQAHVSVGVDAMATAQAAAQANAHAAAMALASAHAEASAGVETIALALADAQAAAYAAAHAQATAETHVAVAVIAAADAFADAAAFAYAAAAAEVSVEARAFAAARTFAGAQASASTSAEAVAIAMSDAIASARAAAFAYARAQASAEATASSLAQAFAMANAAANAEATAQTSVDVVPRIQTSIQAIIDPECLIPVCEEMEPCPPCDERDVPQTTPPSTDSGCPEPIHLDWLFGEIPANTTFRGSKSLPTTLSSTLARYPIANSYIADQNLPPGSSLEVDFDEMMGTVTGTFDPGMTYFVTYLLLDPGQCPIIEFVVTVTTPGEAPQQEQPAETPQTTPQTRACMTVSAAYEVPGFLFFPSTITDISTTIVISGETERITPFQLCATATTQYQLRAGDYATGPAKEQAPFSRWEKYDPIGQTWATYSDNQQIAVPLQSDASYRAVFSEAGVTVTFRPPAAQQQQVCLELSAVFMYQQIATTALYAQPQFITEPISAQILVDDVTRTAPFQLCDDAGSRHVLIPEEEHWTLQEEHLEFWKWQRYNTETESWDDMLLLFYGDIEPGQLSINLQSEGRIRAVYRQAVRLY